MDATRLIGIVAIAVAVGGCADFSPTLPANPGGKAPASFDGSHTFGSGNRTVTVDTTSPPPSPGDANSLSDGEVCYEERGGGAMGSGGRVVVPCPHAST